MTDDATALPMAGIQVLDFSRVLAGPLCTMQMADLGADIVKVEHPVTGDDTRAFKPAEWGGEATFYLSANRSKRSIALDIATDAGRDLVRKLVAQSDVLVENFRPGVMAKHGLEYAAMKAVNPRLIYCSISAYGHASPRAHRPGFDPVLQAESGVMSYCGEPGRQPLRHPTAIVDMFTAMWATQAIMAALMVREKTGRGQHIDQALFDSALQVLSIYGQTYLANGQEPVRVGNGHPSSVPNGLYEAADGPIYVVVGNQRNWERMCERVLERPDMAADPRFADRNARVDHRDELNALLNEIFGSRSRAEWLERFDKGGVPAGAMRNIHECLTSPEVAARGMIATMPHPTIGEFRMIASPLRFSEMKVAPPRHPPLLGEHTDELLAEKLGLDAAAIASLREAKVVR